MKNYEYITLASDILTFGSLFIGIPYFYYTGLVRDPKKAVMRAEQNYSANMSFDKARSEYLHFLRETNFAKCFREPNNEEREMEEKFLAIINKKIPPTLQKSIDAGVVTLETVLEEWKDIAE